MRREIALQVAWVQPAKVDAWLGKMAIGHTLNVCCGMSKVGDVRIDTDSHTNRTQEGNLMKLQFPPLSFDTVICDPPYRYYNHFGWVLKLSDLAKRRLILASDKVNLRRTFSMNRWDIALYAVGDGSTLFIKLYWTFDRKDGNLTEEPV